MKDSIEKTVKDVRLLIEGGYRNENVELRIKSYIEQELVTSLCKYQKVCEIMDVKKIDAKNFIDQLINTKNT